MEYNSIHETVIRDIIDIVQDMKDRDEVDMYISHRNRNSFGSITSKAKDLVMVFPVICSSYMSYEAAAMICKATERKATVLMSMLFSAANICDVENGEDFVRRFHTNIKGGRMTMDDFTDMMDSFVEENNIISATDKVAQENYTKIMDELKGMNFYFEETIRESSIDDFKYIKGQYNNNVLVNTSSVVNEANPFDSGINNNVNRDDSGIAKNLSDIMKTDHSIQTNRIMDSDVKKANELVPSMLYVNYTYTGKDGYPVPTSFVVGIKAKLYVVDGEDIMDRLEIKHSDKNLLLNLIRVGTKELSFFRDFIFAIDRAKIDAMAQSKRGSSSRMWKVLERRALKSKIRRGFNMVNDATAITTLVITQEEVEYLKKTRYIDVENPRIISRIMDAYNMMGFVIVDESLEIAKFLYDDGTGHFEVITFNNLEREQRDNTKKIVNLMSKMSR